MTLPEWSYVTLPNEIIPAGYDHTVEIFNTGSYESDGQHHIMKWKNGPRDILITRSYLWCGLVHDHQADMWCKLIRLLNDSPVDVRTWDRYANPSLSPPWKPCNHILPRSARMDLHFFSKGITAPNVGAHFAAAIDFRYL